GTGNGAVCESSDDRSRSRWASYRGPRAYASFAVIVMSAFRRREMGQPFSAAFAAVWNFRGSAPGTFAATSRWIDFTVQPASGLSKFRVAFVSIRSGWYPSFSSSLDKAIEKQPACAAATSSSGFVPGVSPNRIAKLYGTPLSAPLAVDTAPFPSLRPPFHCALAFRSIGSPHAEIERDA